MKLYEIIKIDIDYKCIVLSTSYISPLDKLYEIKSILINYEIRGMILFDLLLSNGFSSNRFLEIYFDGSEFDKSSANIVSNLPDSLLNMTYEYYYNNPSYINNSILPNAQKYLLQKRMLYKM